MVFEVQGKAIAVAEGGVHQQLGGCCWLPGSEVKNKTKRLCRTWRARVIVVTW